MKISRSSALANHAKRDLALVKKDSSVLNANAEPVDTTDPAMTEIFQKMNGVMKEEGGCGLAAPQVGVPYRMMIVDAGKGTEYLANPEIVESSGKIPSLEGCLSLKGSMSLVMRSRSVTVTGSDEHGEDVKLRCSGFRALAMQHELDHLNGELMTEKAVLNITPKRLVAGLAGFVTGAALKGTTGAMIGGVAGFAGAAALDNIF